MDIEASKIELVKIILNIDNDRFIQKVTDFINNEKADFWNELNDAEQAEIKKGIEQLNKGKRVPFKDVLKKIS
jgi:ribosomal protein L7Ae-like RNA K-turn-binding protein